MRAYWTERGERSVTDEASLSEVIAEVLALGKPTMLFLEEADGSTLVVGIGADETVLTYVDADGASFHSAGDITRQGTLKFWCREQLDDFFAEMALPASSGLDAAKWFVTKGERFPGVTWEPDW